MASDPELVPDPANGDFAVLWERPDRQVGSWLDWCDGSVYTADPDRLMLVKVLQVAALLGARVLGDDDRLFVKVGQELPIWNTP